MKDIQKKDLEDLRKHYLKAKEAGETEFEWRGHKLIVAYAAYLIEFEDMKLKNGKRKLGSKS
jgi:hypothetical protein